MQEVLIRGSDVGKVYQIGRSGPTTLRESLGRLFTPGTSGRSTEMIWALRHVSFEIRHAEVVGIIGRNGAGKSTLLKILSRITEPTEGSILIRGRVGSLLEVGTGFHPELSGRENIFLNGAILGMKNAEIRERVDEIIAFSEVARLIDTPVKHYSSGMYMRLAFAVAAFMDPEILLVDEVLSVGDAAFQKKCIWKMGEVARQGRTVVLVSHNMGTIKSLCSRTIWINEGRIRAEGDSMQVVDEYLTEVSRGFLQVRERGEYVHIDRVVLKNEKGEETVYFRSGEDLLVEIYYTATRRTERPYFWVGVLSKYGPVFGASMLFDGKRPDFVEGEGKFSCLFRSIPLLPQQYFIRVGGRESDGFTPLIQSKDVAVFSVTGTMQEYGYEGEMADTIAWDSAPVRVSYEWIWDRNSASVSAAQEDVGERSD